MQTDELSRLEEQNLILEELCVCNGLKYERIKNDENKHVHKLEMFFSGFPDIVGMSNFPNLLVLCVIGQDTLRKIQGLEPLVQLEELWICETNVENINGLENCSMLKRLYLYDNAISKIDNLSSLKRLEILWLNDNQVECIEGLDNLTYLKELNLSNNKICEVGSSLDKLRYLESLELSGNKIRSLKDLKNLVQFTCLHTLSLNDPVYGTNPVAAVSHYYTYILYHLPQIKHLDGYFIGHETMKELAMTTVKKKKMYYNMRVKTLQRNMNSLLKQVWEERETLKKSPLERKKKLTNLLKTLELIKNESANKQLKFAADKDLDERTFSVLLLTKIEKLQERIQLLECTCEEIDKCYERSCSQVENISNFTIRRLELELETAGNVRFEDGNSNNIWFTSCRDLVYSRFCASDYQRYDVIGIKIHRITRVHNKILRLIFDEKVASIHKKDLDTDCFLKTETFDTSMEYLLLSWTQKLKYNGGFMYIFENGCTDDVKNKDGFIRLSNNLYNADRDRLNEYHPTDLVSLRHGQLVIAKVFVGDHNMTKQDESYEHLPKKFAKIDLSCDCTTKQRDWLINDGDLVLPEYIVDFEYVTKTKAQSSLLCYYGNLSREPAEDSDIVNLKPSLQPQLRLLELSEDLFLKRCEVQSTKSISTLNLHDCGLTHLKNIDQLVNLENLTISFNAVTKLDDIANLHSLKFLDVSYNCLTTLDGLKSCAVLKILNISGNKLQNIRIEVGILRKHAPSITSLNLSHNPWQKGNNYRTYVIGRLRTLQILDDVNITEEENALALRHAASSRISSFIIQMNSRVDSEGLRSLGLAWTSAELWKHSKNKPVVLHDETYWMKYITTLHLEGQGISKLSNLEKLTALKWASFSRNSINKVEGLENCKTLEELDLSKNMITKTDGLSNLVNLKRLDLSYNDITALDGSVMENMLNLEYLCVESNYMTSLQSLKKSTSLQEIYAGNNEIANTREIFYLKELRFLEIIDVSKNPLMSSKENTRMFVIYHLSLLKAINGVAVSATERSCAVDTLGGRMTTDFVAERLGHGNFSALQEIDLPHCELRSIDVGNGEMFRNLRSINLEHNNLTNFGGLIHLINLRVLCLNYNRIESVFPKKKTFANQKRQQNDDVTSPEIFTPVLEQLEVLHLGFNGISNMKSLQLSRIPNIKALFLQGNEISKVEGLQSLTELRELVLDQNRIKTLSETSLIGQRKLIELHLEENRLRNLSNFEALLNLQRLYLGMNKIQDMCELQKLEKMNSLFEISLINNPITRRMLHRPVLVYRQPNIVCIDGIPVKNDERAKAEVYLMENQLSSLVKSESVTETNLPGLQTKHQAQLKVNTVQLSVAVENCWNLGQRRFAQVEHVQNLTPNVRYHDRNNVKGKPRTFNSCSPQHIPSSYDMRTHNSGHHASMSSSTNLDRATGHNTGSAHDTGSYVMQGNPRPNFSPTSKPK
ncbi:leucine-rich repeat-containing protein 9-like [Xenia sp. Carnegie-2017]|uniref:leucine-rich repeat-containing protein 9-like n=1 Tax=Xenia sp. Carnegie-2017 TaxID=2897299 RepID=UPI001F0393E9|nr:leucine-rich repeat-containing protein 9-like [Xenia sp. Carnegie-2017]XP_046860873.1 leucine-rich repeat-containing protein 9-like [Xenia sp. Carnegie-2017]XP_046860876.1 leucine-rich repeat-containing protein 9-like [Xenia sp. Carnegie-2017]